VKRILNGEIDCYWHKEIHNINLDTNQFAQCRINEFQNSCKKLNIKNENIHYFNYPDGKLSYENAIEIITTINELFPGSYHKAPSWTSKNNDAKNLGRALNNLKYEGKICNARFYVLSSEFDICPINNYQETNIIFDKVKFAISEYGIWDLFKNRYAIGFHSDYNFMQKCLQNPINRYHIQIENYV
jgi:hypothetical protein